MNIFSCMRNPSMNGDKLCYLKWVYKLLCIPLVHSLFLLNTQAYAVSLGTPAQISDTTLEACRPSVVTNASGQAVVAWTVFDDGGCKSIQACLYDSGVSTTPTTLSTGLSPCISINSSGDAVVIWLEILPSADHGAFSQVCGAVYDHNLKTWGTPVQISDTTTEVATPCVVIDDSGVVTVLWLERCACRPKCFCRLVACSTYSTAAGVWTTPTFFTTCETYTKNGAIPSLKINSSGQIMAFWAEEAATSGSIDIVAKFYDAGTWNDKIVVASNMASVLLYNGGIDDFGNAMIVWQALRDDEQSTQAATYSQGVWSDPYVVLARDINQRFSMGADGSGVLIWNDISDEENTIQAMIYDNGTWGSLTTLSPHVEDTSLPIVSVGGESSAVALWGNVSDTGTIEVISLSNGSWSSILSVETRRSGCPNQYSVSCNSTGQVVAVWADMTADGSVIMAANGTI